MEQNPSHINPFEPQSGANQPTSTNAGAATGNAAAAQHANTNPVSGNGNNTQTTEQEPAANNYKQPTVRSWILFLLTGFLLMLVYIYNSGHANKALRTKEKLTKELKELHSESISLESQITNASTQSALSKRLEGSGLKEITTPPIKLMRKKKEE